MDEKTQKLDFDKINKFKKEFEKVLLKIKYIL
jgi:hypothetical protein